MRVDGSISTRSCFVIILRRKSPEIVYWRTNFHSSNKRTKLEIAKNKMTNLLFSYISIELKMDTFVNAEFQSILRTIFNKVYKNDWNFQTCQYP
jgi:fido (protein-threonine AMPylation protein)